MTNYLVHVYTYSPYKRENEYRIKASTEAVAINRAVKRYRKEVIPKKKIDALYTVTRKIV
jgi:hypothetical protein